MLHSLGRPERYPCVGRDDSDLQAGHSWDRRGYDGAVLSNEGAI